MLYIHELCGSNGPPRNAIRAKIIWYIHASRERWNNSTEMMIHVDLPYAAKEAIDIGYGCLFLQFCSHPITAVCMSCSRKCKCRL